MTLILCGPPCSGKSFHGRRLANKLGRPFIDIDQLIEREFSHKNGFRLPCREIYKKLGEELFRQLESKSLLQINIEIKSIIALGGGTLLHAENVCYLKSFGSIVFLDVDFTVLWERLGRKKYLPAYVDPHNARMSFEEVVEIRRVVCRQYADSIVTVEDYSEEKVLDLLLKQVVEEVCHG